MSTSREVDVVESVVVAVPAKFLGVPHREVEDAVTVGGII